MNKVLKLAFAFIRERPVRAALTSLASIAAASMVIWVASGYDALLVTFDEYANLALGRYQLSIAPISKAAEQSVSPDVIQSLRKDPAIAAVDPLWLLAGKVRKLDANGQPVSRTATRREGFGGGPHSRLDDAAILATDCPLLPFDMAAGTWLPTDEPEAMRGVLRADAAQRLNAAVGDELLVEIGSGSATIKVVGVVNAPAMSGYGAAALSVLTPSSGELYLSVFAARQIAGREPAASLAGVSLKPEADLTRFRFGWAPKLSKFDIPVQFQEAHDIEEALDQAAAAQNVQMQAYAVSGIAMLVALLVIFCTLSMGVNERIRQLAILRAVVFTRRQVALLVVAEGLLLGAIGFAGGALLGKAFLAATASASRLLHHGATVGTMSLMLAAAATFGGALLASLLPAWRATRVKPVEAMSLRPRAANNPSISRRTLILGMLLLSVNPLITFVFPPKFEAGVFVTMGMGFACMALGFVLLSPTIVGAVDRWGTPVLARLMRLDPKLLASQITSHLWRTVGAATSLAVGMGLYIAVQVWGYTMLDAFIPGSWVPDALVAFRPAGLAPEHARQMAKIPGVDPKRCLPIVVEQPRLAEDITHSAQRASVTRQDNVVIIGLDPQAALGGAHPLLALEWTNGTPHQAISSLREQRGCVVPDHFLAETGLTLGDKIALVPPENAQTPVEYVIAGAVRLPGWHWQTKMTGFRTRTHRAAALVFADYDNVAKDFDLPAASYVWFAYDGPTADPDRIAAAARDLLAAATGQPAAIGAAAENEPAVRIMPVENIRNQTRSAAKRWIWVISQIPLVAFAIASLGVLNVMLASVRARRWEMGVLRSLGFTNWTLVRAVLAEGMLIGLVACVLSVGFGIMAGWCGCGIAQYMSFFGGLHPSLVVPWGLLFLGLVAVLCLSTLSAIWPAILIGRSHPLALLQEGRSAI